MAYHPALQMEHGSLHGIVEYQTAIYLLLVLMNKRFAQSAVLCRQRDEFLIIERYSQPFRQKLAYMMATATILTGNGDDER